MEAVIESRRRATYTEIQREWDQNRRNTSWEYAPHFELFALIRKQRAGRGSLDFDLPEAELDVAPDGVVRAIRKRQRWDSHRLIEEFMIAANEAVTDWARARAWPFIYRIHDEPADQSLEKFSKLAATVGVKLKLSGENLALTLSDLVQRLEGHPAQSLLNMALLRAMKQAVYSAAHGIHFGLASPGYTHFTSPIRRYPDLVVHRILRMALRKEKPHGSLERELEEIAEHCSYRERVAQDAEREAIRLKQTRAMVERLGDEFDARVIGMAEAGLFVELDDPYVEGLISVDSMTDDAYQFNEERMVFAGRRKKRTFKIGDRVRVRAVRADLDRRQVDFALLDGPRQIPPR
jgi:ribonuclease R